MWRLGSILILSLLSLVAPATAGEHSVVVDGKSPGRVFEGFGALSAGASSRLLYDYPEPQRSQILDFLFRPGFGASLHHLKVEIGGDVNSTDGSEPSHAITREELEKPQPACFQRGYEWWLMKEARKRNPAILLEGLQWGAPGWIGGGKFFSRDNAEFVAAWIKGAQRHHGLSVDYVGIWNENRFDTAYIKLLRKVLDANGLGHVKIDAGDQWELEDQWAIADELERDPALRRAVAAINSHITGWVNFRTTKAAKRLQIPLWDGEAHAYGGDWYAAANHARQNRAYPVGQITKVISWSLITAYHDFLPVPGSGMMKANTPWSGHYEVQPPLWILAHFNQFAKPGWRYLDSACRLFADEMTREGFSITAMRAPDSGEYSIFIESMDAKEDQTARFEVSDDLSRGNLAVWRSTFKGGAFLRQDDIEVTNGTFTLAVEPNSMYTLTTTRGQQKGAPSSPIPEPASFPFPYVADFEREEAGGPGRYFSDQHGTYVVTPRPDGEGQCLKQMVRQQGIRWRQDYTDTQTILGDIGWTDYAVSAEVLLPEPGTVKLWGRMHGFESGNAPFPAYGFLARSDGNWQLTAGSKVLAAGDIGAIQSSWHRMSLCFRGDRIQAEFDGRLLSEVRDSSIKAGLVGLGTDWNTALFDNVRVSAVR